MKSNKLLLLFIVAFCFYHYSNAINPQNRYGKGNSGGSVYTPAEFFQDLVEPQFEEGFQIRYSYSQLGPSSPTFPIGFGAAWMYNTDYYIGFNLGTDWGVCVNHNDYKIQVQHGSSSLKYRPSFYALFTPGIMVSALFSIDCGVGWAFTRLEDGTDYITTTIDNTLVITSVSKFGGGFMVQPSFSLNVPLGFGTGYILPLRFGYNYVHKIPELCGWFVGVGFGFERL